MDRQGTRCFNIVYFAVMVACPPSEKETLLKRFVKTKDQRQEKITRSVNLL